LPLPAGAEITTIDISQDQLNMNTYATEKLLGDLQSFDYGARRFDLVVCWDVLEHLERPEAALLRLANVLKPGGRLVLKGPIPRTLKGLVTQFTPHWLHVIFYRRVLGSVQAGFPGHPPFKAHMNRAAGPLDAASLVTAEGLTVDTLRGYESQHVAAIAAKSRWALKAYRATERGLELVTGGRYQGGMTDFFLIAHR
jgi:SAM-dependent methyltransferase